MQHLGVPELLVILFVAAVLFGGKKFSNFRGGGPGHPSHPIPGDDSGLLNRKRKRPD